MRAALVSLDASLPHDPFVTLLEIHRSCISWKLGSRSLTSNEALRTRRNCARPARRGPPRATPTEAPADKQLNLVPGGIEDARALEGARLERVSTLVEGPRPSESCSRLYIGLDPSDNRGRSDSSRTRGMCRQFSERQIRLALHVLGEKGWLLSSRPSVTELLFQALALAGRGLPPLTLDLGGKWGAL